MENKFQQPICKQGVPSLKKKMKQKHDELINEQPIRT